MDELIPGVHEWTHDEITEKESAVARGKQRSFAHIIQSAVEGEFDIVPADELASEAEWTYLLTAQNHLLAQLNFPNNLKPFLDAITSAACGVGSNEFAALNYEIAQKSRSGRAACSDRSMEKWVGVQKKKLDEWQFENNFSLVDIKPGRYDFENKKSEPTRYRVFFNKNVARAVQIAKTKFYWEARASQSDDRRKYRSDQQVRSLRNRALREAARQTLMELPEGPNLRPKPAKTLSEEEKFDRRHHSMLTFMKKNRDLLKKMGFEPVEYFRFLISEIDKIATNPSGMAGALLTPDADEPDADSSVWRLIQSGELAERIDENSDALDTKIDRLEANGFDHVAYASEVSMASDRPVQTPKAWVDGELVDASQKFGKVEQLPMSDNTVIGETCPMTVYSDIGENAPMTVKSDIGEEPENRPMTVKSDIGETPMSVYSDIGRSKGLTAISDENEPEMAEAPTLIVVDDFSDWFDDAAQTGPTLPTLEDLRAIFNKWIAQVRAKIPDKSGALDSCFQVYWGDQFDAHSKDVEANLSSIMELIPSGHKPVSAFKPAFVDWIMTRVTYYKDGVPQRTGYQSRYFEFRKRLGNFLQLPEGFEE